MESLATQNVRIFNSLSGIKEDFTPINKKSVGMYVCGPTVYSKVHLGNCRTFISFDIVYRYLKFLGYKVRYVRNITDAGHLENDADEGEDRIAKKARIEEIEPMEVVQKYTVDFHQTLTKFNTLPPSIEPTSPTLFITKGIKYQRRDGQRAGARDKATCGNCVWRHQRIRSLQRYDRRRAG